MNWQFTDQTGHIVFRVLEDGSMESMTVDAPEIQAWIVAGNTPAPATPIAIPIPSAVSMRQARLALLQSGLLSQVNTTITNSTDESAKIEWEYATEVQRNSLLVLSLSSQLGLTEEQVDALFMDASTR